MIKIRRTVAIAAGAAAALAIGGTAALAADPTPSPSVTDDRGGSVPLRPDGDPIPSASSDDSTASPGPSASSPATVTVPPATSALSIGVEQAKAIALSTAGGGRVTKVESEFEHGRPIWKVVVVSGGVGHEIYVDKAGGSVVRDRTRSAGTSTAGPARDDEGGLRAGGSDDPATHDAGDDKGGNRGGHGGHGGDDQGGDDHGHGSDD